MAPVPESFPYCECRDDRARRLLPENFAILDQPKQVQVLQQIMRQVGMVALPRGTSPPAWQLLQQIQKWKEHGLRPADIDVAAGDIVGRNARALYPEYQRRLLERGMLDYTDLTLGVLRLFSTRPDVLQHYRRRFRHVLVDELQARPTARPPPPASPTTTALPRPPPPSSPGGLSELSHPAASLLPTPRDPCVASFRLRIRVRRSTN